VLELPIDFPQSGCHRFGGGDGRHRRLAHWPESALAKGSQANVVIVRKAARRLELYRDRRVTRGVDPGGLVMIHGMKNGLGWLGHLNITAAS